MLMVIDQPYPKASKSGKNNLETEMPQFCMPEKAVKVLHCWLLSLLLFKAHADASEASVKFLKAPKPFSRLNSAKFLFQVPVGGNGSCTDCTISCKLDDGIASDCGAREVSYTGLQDGNHTFVVCSNGSLGISCSSYTWIVGSRSLPLSF
ncbi:hypothetical protein Patl1_18064 [Pistacia atlantica]|uniref:Uncharacterized protein n=1 Tax=Pistacia atlantica TaxID=434234 RepID=A0ACC1C212_9ROSI|nr:hypothetical protein Patl1_18064 [Pistacia atlantica]